MFCRAQALTCRSGSWQAHESSALIQLEMANGFISIHFSASLMSDSILDEHYYDYFSSFFYGRSNLFLNIVSECIKIWLASIHIYRVILTSVFNIILRFKILTCTQTSDSLPGPHLSITPNFSHNFCLISLKYHRRFHWHESTVFWSKLIAWWKVKWSIQVVTLSRGPG